MNKNIKNLIKNKSSRVVHIGVDGNLSLCGREIKDVKLVESDFGFVMSSCCKHCKRIYLRRVKRSIVENSLNLYRALELLVSDLDSDIVHGSNINYAKGVLFRINKQDCLAARIFKFDILDGRD